MSQFVALDVETANSDPGSICQVGIVKFRDGQVVENIVTLVDPEDYFDEFNIAIHGITERMVQGAPKFPTVLESFQRNFAGDIIVHHTAFDLIAFRRAAARYGLPEPCFTSLDSARIARRTWEEVRQRGYNLPNLASRLGIKYRAHDAAEDARAAGLVVLHAIEESGISLEEWLTRQHWRTTWSRSQKFAQDGNPDGEYSGETVVFTGELSISREEAARIAAEQGCTVADNVTKQTTWLVVGAQDLRMTRGKEKSTKHRRAEELIQKGHEIRILKEKDFFELIEYQPPETNYPQVMDMGTVTVPLAVSTETKKPPAAKNEKSKKSILVVLILWIFLGLFGAHRWYAGVGSWVYTLTLGFVGIGWIFDFVIILTGGLRDSEGKPIWFGGNQVQKSPPMIVAIPNIDKPRDKQKNLPIWIAFFVLVILMVIWTIGSRPDSTGSASGPSPRTAWYMCEAFIEKNLKAPKTAEFQRYQSDQVRQINENTFEVSIYVDAENSFGAMLRNRFVCEVENISGDEWMLLNLEELD